MRSTGRSGRASSLGSTLQEINPGKAPLTTRWAVRRSFHLTNPTLSSVSDGVENHDEMGHVVPYERVVSQSRHLLQNPTHFLTGGLIS